MDGAGRLVRRSGEPPGSAALALGSRVHRAAGGITRKLCVAVASYCKKRKCNLQKSEGSKGMCTSGPVCKRDELNNEKPRSVPCLGGTPHPG